MYPNGRSDNLICRILLIVVIGWSLINILIWFRIDTRPPRWDEAGYLALSLLYHDALTSGGMGAFTNALLTYHRIQPPLVSALAVPAYLLFGRSAEVAFAVHILAFIVLILAVYGLGARLVSPWCGLLAAFFVSTYPGISSLSRLFYQDFCNVALVAVSLYLLVRTEGFSRRQFSLALGVVLGLGLLCRAFFPIFLVGSLGVGAYAAWRESRRHGVSPEETGKSRWWVNGGLALLVGAVIAGPWYVVNFIPLVLRSLSAAYGTLAIGFGPNDPLTLFSLANYFINFVNVHLTFVGFGIFLLALAILLVKRPTFLSETRGGTGKPIYSLCILLASIFVPYLFFTLLRSQDPKNIGPVLPAIAVVTAWGLTLLLPAPLKRALIGLSVTWSLFHYWLGMYGLPAFPQQVGWQVREDMYSPMLWQQGLVYPAPGFLLPRREHWPIAEVLERITGGSVGPNRARVMTRPAVVAVLANHASFNYMNFWHTFVLEQLPILNEHPGDAWSPEGKEYRTQLLGVDFAVIKVNSKTDEPDPPVDPYNPYYAEMVAFLRSSDSPFVEIAPRFPLPDGSQAVVYALRNGPVSDGVPEISYATPVSFNNEVELLGYDLEDKGQTSRGRAFLVTYYWKALKKITSDYQVFAHITRSGEPDVVTSWDHSPARGRWPTSFWQPGTVIEDRGLYFLPSGEPVDSYRLRVGLLLPATGERLKVAHAAPGIVLDDGETRAAIGTIWVRR